LTSISGIGGSSGGALSGGPPIAFGGLESGLDTSAIINAEMSIYDQPLVDLQNQQSQTTTELSAYQKLSSDFTSLESAAEALSAPDAFSSALAATSSDSEAATATVGSGAEPGTLSFSVEQLATGTTLLSSGTVASPDDVVASGNLLVGVGGQALGITNLQAGSGLASGSHTITVTQASAGAAVTGTSALAGTTTITSGTNDQLTVSLDGTSTTYTIAAGTYTQSQLAQAVQTASGGALSASVNGQGELVLTTTQQGSAATLAVTGGDALGSLGMSASTTASSGQNAIVNVDGTDTTVTNLSGSGPTTLSLTSGTGGSIDVTVSGGLKTGTMSADELSVGSGSLADVVSALNGSGLALSAGAVQVASGEYALEVSSTTTGSKGAVEIDPSAFASSSLGTLDTVTQAQDAEIALGGVSGDVVKSDTNTFSNLLPGLSVNVSQTTTSPVSITVAPSGSAIEPQVKALVDAANTVLSDIATDVAYNPKTNQAGPLNGAFGVESLAQQVLSIVGQALGQSVLGSKAEAAGVTLNSNGTLSFDPSAFDAAFDANPSAVASMFTQGGSFTPSSSTYAGQVSLLTAESSTQPGSYQVQITHAATQAQDLGTVGFASASSTVGSADTYTVTEGSLSATLSVSAGESLSQIVTGFDQAFAQAGLGLSAAVTTNSSGQSVIELASAGYGSSQSFTVSSSSSTDPLGISSSSAFSGTDVAGTIDGVAATGDGQVLSLPTTAPSPAAGLALLVTTPSVSGTTTLGSFDYSPGLAQSLASLASQVTTGPGGAVASAISELETDQQSLGIEIASEQQVVDAEQAQLEAEFNALATQLASLNAQGAVLGAVSGSAPTTSSSTTTTGGAS